MIDSHYRNRYQTYLVDPVVRAISRSRIKPSAITAAALLTGAAAGISLALHQQYLAFAALVISGYLDTLDGSLARSQQSASPSGAALDIVSDRCVEASIILGLYAWEPETRGLPCLLMLASVLVCVTTFLVVGIFQNQQSHKSFYYSPGLMERSEAFLFFSVMILFPAMFYEVSLIFSFLVALTGFYRLWEFKKAMDRQY